MKYFDTLPKFIYLNPITGHKNIMTNIMARASIMADVLNNPLIFYTYDLQEGDTPEIVAHKYYGDSYRYWLILFANQYLDPQWNWPLSYAEFNAYIEDKYIDNNMSLINLNKGKYMSKIVDKLTKAQQYAISIRPKVGGFPVLAEVLRQAGVKINRWFLPSCQYIYLTRDGAVVQQGIPIIKGTHEISNFDLEALISAIRSNQEGLCTFLEFLFIFICLFIYLFI